MTAPILPNEISKIVADYLDKDDLPAFRLSSKSHCANASEAFVREYFTEIPVFMSLRSLDMLIQICKHPLFGSYVRRITFASQVLADRGLESARNKLHGAREDTKAEVLQTVMKYADSQNEQSALDYTKRGLQLLSLALEHLRSHGNLISLGMRDVVGSPRFPGSTLGSKTFCSFIKYDAWEARRTAVLGLLFDAAVSSGCAVAGLSLNMETLSEGDRDYERRTYDIGIIELRGYDLSKLSSVCTRLRFLELRLDKRQNNSWTEDTLGLLIRKCPNLEEAFLTVHDNNADEDTPTYLYHHYAFIHCLGLLRSTHLNTLRLHGLPFHEQGIISCLNYHKGTLHTLEIKESLVGVYSRWSNIFNWILENLELDKLEVAELWALSSTIDHGRHQTYDREQVMFGTRTYEGEDIKTGLQALIREVTTAEVAI
ncbi:hypothetical protein BDV97DRAFT_403413 [Delphinella strobiligena]|nr:hypothetical protein BDV97DRAFT_403413 [Delphinella strobiligena]